MLLLKCGCEFNGKSFVKHCRFHAEQVLKKRAENSDSKWYKTIRVAGTEKEK